MKKLMLALVPMMLFNLIMAENVELGPDESWYCDNSTINTTVVCKPDEMCSAMNILYQNCNTTKIMCEDDLSDLEQEFDTMKSEYDTCKSDRDRYKAKAVQQTTGTGNEVFFMDEYLMCEKNFHDKEEENAQIKIDYENQLNDLRNQKMTCESNLEKEIEDYDKLKEEMKKEISDARLWTAVIVGGLVYWWSKRKKDELLESTGSTQPINII